MEEILSNKRAYWIGLSDIRREGKFVWQQSQRPLGPWGGKWHGGEPSGLREDCVQMHVQFGEWGWNDSKCGATNVRNIYAIHALCETAQLVII